MKTHHLPPDLASALKQFEEFRSYGKVRPFPNEYWEMAGRLSEIHGAFKVASVLRLNATTLRKRSTSLLSGKSKPKIPTELVKVQPVKIGSSIIEKKSNRVVAELSMPTGFTLKVFSDASADQLKALISIAEEVS